MCATTCVQCRQVLNFVAPAAGVPVRIKALTSSNICDEGARGAAGPRAPARNISEIVYIAL